MKVVLAGIALIVVIGVFYFLWNRFGPGARRKQTQKRIERIRSRKTTVKTMQDMSLRRKAEESKGMVYWLMKPLPDFKRLGDMLERAGKTISPKRYVFRRFISFAGIALVAVLLQVNPFIAVSAGVIFGVWIPFKLIKFSIKRQTKAFLKLFPDAIDLIVRGLRSGLPVSESIVLVSHEIAEPVGGVFTNVANTMKLGVPLEKALTETAKRLDMTEFNFFTTSIILQRETGGNLSEILNNLSDVLRGRFLMRMKIKAMSSEARASAMIIGALPFFVIGALAIISPSYMAPLIDDYRGNICAAIAVGMMSSGLWIMNRMTQFEI